MKHVKFCWVFLLVAAALGWGGEATTLRSADGQYQLSVPDGWAAKDFHLDNVAIGASNESRGEYVEIIAELPKDFTNSFHDYATAKCDTMAASLIDPKVVQDGQMRINGWDGMRFEIHGELPDVHVSVGYLLTVLKTDKHYIQVVAWTAEKHFSDNVQELSGLAGGFAETDSGK